MGIWAIRRRRKGASVTVDGDRPTCGRILLEGGTMPRVGAGTRVDSGHAFVGYAAA